MDPKRYRHIQASANYGCIGSCLDVFWTIPKVPFNHAQYLTWPKSVFPRALAKAMQRARKDCKKIYMASIQQSFYLLNASAI